MAAPSVAGSGDVSNEDERFLTCPPMVEGVADSESSRAAAVARKRRRCAKRDRARRAALITDLTPVAPMGITASTLMTRAEVADFYGISARSHLSHFLRKNGDELASAGWNRGGDDKFAASAIVLIGLMMHARTSPMAAQIKRALDPEISEPLLIAFGDMSVAVAAQTRAMELIADVRDAGAGEVWTQIREWSEFEKLSTLVALAALVPDDIPLGEWVKRQDPGCKRHPLGGSVARGLSTLIPTEATAAGKSIGDAFPITDSAAGLW